MIDQWRKMSAEDRELMLDTSEAVAKDYVVNLEAARRGVDPANNGRIHGCDVLGMATALVLAREEVRELRADRAHLTAECDRLLEKVAALTVENADLKEQRAVFGEDLDCAFLDGYGAAYIKARPGRFVPMTEYADEAADALTEWHKDNGVTVDNACVGCGSSIPEGRTHCGSLECGGGSLPDIADETTGDRDQAAIDDTWSAP